MADNIITNLGNGGPVIASDEVSGVQFPRGKFTLGDDGVNDGDVSKTNPMPTAARLVNDAAFDLVTLVLSSRQAVTGYQTGPKVVFSVLVENKNSASRYLLLKNQPQNFTSAQTPDMLIAVPGNSIIVVGPNFFGPNGARFPTGLSWGWSTDPGSYVAGTAANHITQIRGL